MGRQIYGLIKLIPVTKSVSYVTELLALGVTSFIIC